MTAVERTIEDELDLARHLIEEPGCRVLVVGIVSDEPAGAERLSGAAGSGRISRAVSAEVTVRDARIFVEGLKHEIQRIEELLARKAGQRRGALS